MASPGSDSSLARDPLRRQRTRHFHLRKTQVSNLSASPRPPLYRGGIVDVPEGSILEKRYNRVGLPRQRVGRFLPPRPYSQNNDAPRVAPRVAAAWRIETGILVVNYRSKKQRWQSEPMLQ